MSTPDSSGASKRRLGPTRARVLALLQDTATPMTAHEVAERMGLHPNTARFHLEALETSGLADRRSEDRTRPGRPRALFTATTRAPDATDRSYRLLAEILTGYLTSVVSDPSAGAQEAGVGWGRFLAGPTPPFRKVEADEAVRALVEKLDEIGFESHTVASGDDVRLDIHHCPFLELAEEHRDVVCAVHLGLMRGLLEEMRAPVTAESLDPLVEPSRCIAHLRAG